MQRRQLLSVDGHVQNKAVTGTRATGSSSRGSLPAHPGAGSKNGSGTDTVRTVHTNVSLRLSACMHVLGQTKKRKNGIWLSAFLVCYPMPKGETGTEFEVLTSHPHVTLKADLKSDFVFSPFDCTALKWSLVPSAARAKASTIALA